MKKILLVMGSILIAGSSFAHEHFMFTENLDVSGKSEIKIKAILGHPAKGKNANPINIATIDGISHLPKEFYVVHNGKKQNLLEKAKLGVIKSGDKKAISIDATYGIKDGLKGSGNWVFIMDSGQTEDSGYTFNPSMKLIVAKDGDGFDYMNRVAEGQNEIVPLVSPVNAWKENIFRAKFIDENGNPIKGARVDVKYLNANFNVKNDTYKGGRDKEKVSVRIFTDDNGIFAFNPSREGHWIIRAVKFIDKDKKTVSDASLVVQFK